MSDTPAQAAAASAAPAVDATAGQQQGMTKSARRRQKAKAKRAAAGDAPQQGQGQGQDVDQKTEQKQQPRRHRQNKRQPNAPKQAMTGNIPIHGIPGTEHERTFIAIKPDGVQRGKIGNIISRFEDKGFKLVAMKELTPTKAMAAEHYSDLSKKGFFNGLCEYFSSGPIIAMVWEGKGAILTGRVLLGQTNPADSAPGSMRGDLCVEVGRNICHGSDGPEGAQTEITYWFNPGEICNWNAANNQWVYENSKLNKRAEQTAKTGKHHTASEEKIAPAGQPGTKTERTFIAIKPDGVQRGKIGNIIARFEAKGFVLAAMKVIWPTKEMAAAHYADLSAKPFFKGLVEYFSMGPIVAMVWEGKGAIKTGRVLLGETDPAKSMPGTIRGDLCIEVGRNICHGSDGVESAGNEIGFWFDHSEISDWTPAASMWIYE